VYAGNLTGRVGSLEDTVCPKCSRVLIQRRGYRILTNLVTAGGTCPHCGTAIAGVFG
jgi:pyruvate formate lyase activating enzyme